RENGTIATCVKDTGAGIREADIVRVFEPFVQIDRTLTAVPQQGVGLGLSISRELAQAMHGDLTLESKAGAGSTFTLTLPAAVGQPESISPLAARA
ncbi:MAG TPA: ATP-binding protein, partial [Gemmatimonadaceae bacterium]|nr:ATP-binding protein [Gemmatimonadaceae bacterium]